MSFNSCFWSLGKLEPSRWNARDPWTSDDGSGRSGRHSHQSLLLLWDEILQHLWRRHGGCCAQLQRLGTGPGGGAVSLSPWIPGSLLWGNCFNTFSWLFFCWDFNHCICTMSSCRTVPLDTLVPVEVYTWVTVSSVNVTATLSPATQRQASAR